MDSKGFERNGIIIGVGKHPDRKRPRLFVQIDNENEIYYIAGFPNEKSALWFYEIMEEFLKGMIADNTQIGGINNDS